MLRIDTLRRSLLLALLPGAAMMAACGGAVDGTTLGADPAGTQTQSAVEGEPGTDPNAAPSDTDETVDVGDAPIDPEENKPGDEVALTASGAPADELEVDMAVEGKESEDPGFEAALEGMFAEGAEQGDEQFAEADAQVAEGDVQGETAGEPQAEGEALVAQAEPQAETSEGEIGQSSDALGSARGTKILGEAKRNTSHLKKSTSYYSHTTYMNESTGTRRTDCSGLVGYVLKRTISAALDKVPHPGRSKALADDYYRYFKTRPTSASTQSATRWRRITSVKNLKPGDMVVWTYPSWNENTGHIMIVKDYPRRGRTTRGEWIVPIIDSTATPHAYNAYDSRGTRYTGVGYGQIGLKVDSSGAPKAYYWTGGSSKTASYRPIAMARVE